MRIAAAAGLVGVVLAGVGGGVLALGADSDLRTIFDGSSGAGWIIIRSSAWQSLPPAGTRVGPQHIAMMAKITTDPGALSDYAVQTQEGAHHYRFIGIEVTGADPLGGQQYGLFMIDGSYYDANSVYHLQPTSALAPQPHAAIGFAAHSVRAVPAAALAVIGPGDRPFHVHLSEQRAENEACRARYWPESNVLRRTGRMSSGRE